MISPSGAHTAPEGGIVVCVILSLLELCHHLQCSNSTLTMPSYRTPRGANFICASRDYLLPVLSKCSDIICNAVTAH